MSAQEARTNPDSQTAHGGQTQESTTHLDELDTGHEYDGIREHDNRLPNWWLATLIISIIFGYGYWVYYHMLDGTPDQLAMYQAEMDQAEALAAERAKGRGDLTDEAFVAMSQLPGNVSGGSTSYGQFCASCHGDKGQGLIGPNLTDTYWIHGGRPSEIFSVIANGATAKGMPAWEGVLGREKVEQVVAYLLTIKGTEVSGGKAPEGNPEG